MLTVKFNKTTDCDFPRMTFREGRTFVMPDQLAEKFIKDGVAEQVKPVNPLAKPSR